MSIYVLFMKFISQIIYHSLFSFLFSYFVTDPPPSCFAAFITYESACQHVSHFVALFVRNTVCFSVYVSFCLYIQASFCFPSLLLLFLFPLTLRHRRRYPLVPPSRSGRGKSAGNTAWRRLLCDHTESSCRPCRNLRRRTCLVGRGTRRWQNYTLEADPKKKAKWRYWGKGAHYCTRLIASDNKDKHKCRDS